MNTCIKHLLCDGVRDCVTILWLFTGTILCAIMFNYTTIRIGIYYDYNYTMLCEPM